MNATSEFLAEGAARPAGTRTRRTVDAPTRAFHWLMALSFAGAYATAEVESLRLVHVTLGYSVAGLIVARLVWGLAGPRPSRLSSWASRLKPLWRWPRGPGGAGLASLRPALGMLAIVGIMLAGVATVTSGIVLYQEWLGGGLEDAIEEVHEGAGNAMLALVLGHLAWLLMGLLRRGPAQALSMFTGRVPGQGPDLVRRNRPWLGMALVAAVLGFWAWQWQSAPPPEGGAQGPVASWWGDGHGRAPGHHGRPGDPHGHAREQGDHDDD